MTTNSFYPWWVKLASKTILLLVLITSLAYAGTTTWGIRETLVKAREAHRNETCVKNTSPHSSFDAARNTLTTLLHSSISTTYPPTTTTPQHTTFLTSTTTTPLLESTPSDQTEKTPHFNVTCLPKPSPRELEHLISSVMTVEAVIFQMAFTLNLLLRDYPGLKKRTYKWILIESLLLLLVAGNYILVSTFGEHKHGGYEGGRVTEHGTPEDRLHSHDFWITVTFFLYSSTLFLGCLISGVVMVCGVDGDEPEQDETSEQPLNQPRSRFHFIKDLLHLGPVTPRD